MVWPAGWYPDPNVPAHQRWWDGKEWTPHVRPVEASADDPSSRSRDQSSSATKPAVHGFLGRLGASTYVALGLLALLLVPFAATGGFFVWLALAMFLLLLTGLYTLLTGRRSWAHIRGRRAGAVVIGASVVCLLASVLLVGETAPVANKEPVVPTSAVAASPTISAPGTPTPTAPSILVTPTPTPSALATPTAQSEPTSAAPDTTATAIASPPPEAPTTSPSVEAPTTSSQPTTASPPAEATNDASTYAAKYTQALLARIHASTFAETCGRSVSLGGNAWACVIDHLASPDDQTIEIYLTSSADFALETRVVPTIFDKVTVTQVPNLNTCVYHFAAIAPDAQRVDWYTPRCRTKHDSLL
ncbi:DUF2510 domain-containing protein [Arthrobacter sp. B1I2]|uniref:DUF2510 domain-containing protein n=1 Tax=Arthrobacter sp. B1I2 TaxID=3042263 RepID=UPI002786B654|nr:hypothetical protein [Arthrobacter sp. B1I2]